MTFLVEGRRFDNRLHAITFAHRLADEYDRSIDVKMEVRDRLDRVRRTWVCRMHPAGDQHTLLRNAGPFVGDECHA